MSLENGLELSLKRFGDEIRRLRELNRAQLSDASQMSRKPDDDEHSDTGLSGRLQTEPIIRRLLDREATGSTEKQRLQRICGNWIVMQQWKLNLTNETVAKRTDIPVEIIQLLQLGLADEPLADEDRWSLLSALLVDDTHDYDCVEAIVYLALGNQTFADAQTIEVVTQYVTDDNTRDYEAIREVMAGIRRRNDRGLPDADELTRRVLALLIDKPEARLEALPASSAVSQQSEQLWHIRRPSVASSQLVSDPIEDTAPYVYSEALYATYVGGTDEERQRRAYIAVVYVMTAAISQVLIQFTEMLTNAMQQPQPAGEFRSANPVAEHSSYQEVQAPPKEFTYQFQGSSPYEPVVTIDFTLTDTERRLYRLRVTVIDQDQDPFSQDGHQVMIYYLGLKEKSITDTNGCATTLNVPYAALPQLQITINLRSSEPVSE